MDDTRCASTGPVSLTTLGASEWGDIGVMAPDDPDGPMLRAMGLKPGAQVRMCHCRGSCVVEVRWCGGPACRLGLSRELAKRVMVAPVRNAVREAGVG